VNTGTTFVAHRQTAKTMQPGEGSFDHPARAAEAAPVRGAAFRELRRDAARQELIAMGLRIVAAIPLDQPRGPRRAARPAAEHGHRVHQRQQLGDVVPVRGRQLRDERNPVRVGENMMLRPGLAAIGRVRSSFFPPRSARSEALSTTARARSSWPRRRNSVSRTVCRRFQTPARCHRASRRQQVLPEPQPISGGSMFQGIPLRSTKRIPVKTARSGIGVRPAYCRFLARRLGSRGSIRVHRSSSMSAWAIPDRLALGQPTVPSPESEYKRSVS